MSLLEKAIALAVEAHQGQVDKYGQPYVLHPLRLMLRMNEPEAQMVAILHDVVEDTSWTVEQLAEQGFPTPVIQAVDTLTHLPEESYAAYILRTAASPLARQVKIADLEDNMDIRRLRTVTERDRARMEKYLRSWRFLTGKSETLDLSDLEKI
jgi:(p)ppGpp synthase/HD superfamily hydrolase